MIKKLPGEKWNVLQFNGYKALRKNMLFLLMAVQQVIARTYILMVNF